MSDLATLAAMVDSYPRASFVERTRSRLVRAASQAYYWQATWQRDEATAADDVAAGRVDEFDSADDAARFLLDGEPIKPARSAAGVQTERNTSPTTRPTRCRSAHVSTPGRDHAASSASRTTPTT